MNIIAVTKHYVRCPHCGENSGKTVDHLLPTHSGWGDWYCDECGGGFRGSCLDGVVSVWPSTNGRRFVKAYALLCVQSDDGPVFFVLDDPRYCPDSREQTPSEIFDHFKFRYEEHSCPENWMRNTVKVLIKGDDDPHGALKFVASVDHDKAVRDEHGELDALATFSEAMAAIAGGAA